MRVCHLSEVFFIPVSSKKTTGFGFPHDRLHSSPRLKNASTYSDYRLLRRIPSRITWFFASNPSDDIIAQWAIGYPWKELNMTVILTILESSLPETIKQSCVRQWDWLSSAPTQIWTILERDIPEALKLECVKRWDWSSFPPTYIWTLLEGGTSEEVKLECISHWEWSRVTLTTVMAFLSCNKINEVITSIIRHVEWSSYSADELEHAIANTYCHNDLLTIGHSCM